MTLKSMRDSKGFKKPLNTAVTQTTKKTQMLTNSFADFNNMSNLNRSTNKDKKRDTKLDNNICVDLLPQVNSNFS
jgi:hypothetical protein